MLRLLCEQMLDSSSWIGMENRALLIVLWHLLGQINEVAQLRSVRLKFDPLSGAVMVKLLPPKATKPAAKALKHYLGIVNVISIACCMHWLA
ncbi:hypothetical protein Plhal703r1_c66g0169481 [Plasmopara halstedii]